MGLFDTLAGKIARLAVKNVTLDDARRRHEKRAHMPSLFDYEQIGRDHRDGKISAECYRWLEVVIITESGTPVYSEMLTTLEDSDRPEYADFKRFVLDIWTKEESEHGETCRKVGDAIGFTFDISQVRQAQRFIANYKKACPPCARVIGTAAYTVVQEEITYMAHRAYAECSGSAELARVGRTIAAEERYHSLFYANRLREIVQIARDDGIPDAQIFAPIAEAVQRFEMPTVMHTEAHRAHVSPTHTKQAQAYLRDHMGEIKRQLAPMFIAAGGLALVEAIKGKGFPLGELKASEAAELAAAVNAPR
jgi:hypothetical protein